MDKSTTVRVRVKVDGDARVAVRVSVKGRQPLRFGRGNAKLDDAIYRFSLPAGHSCPFADACKSKANRETGRIRDGANTQFRCYAASMECRHSSVRRSRWHNFSLLRACKGKQEMAQLILDSLSPFAGYVRIHDSGDFYSQDYFDAWLAVARRRPDTLFYAYTKALPFWVARLDDIPDNFILTASYGGTHDHLIEEHSLRCAYIAVPEEEHVPPGSKGIISLAEVERRGLELDHDDSHAMRPGPSFALLIHGAQPAGSLAAKALSALRSQGEFGYGERADEIRRERGRMALAMA